MFKKYTADYTSSETIDEEYGRILEIIGDKAGYYGNVADYVNDEIDKLEGRNTVSKAAFLWAIDEIQQWAEEVLINTVLEGCVESGEFNYDLYANQIIRAVRYHFSEILNISHDGYIVDVRVNFSPLGSVDMWAAAVEAVRNEQGWGATRGITEWEGSEDSDDLDLASHMWREKIYQVDREGGKVYKSKKVKDENGEEKTETVDVTENYLGKYRRTIELRLAAIPENTAPFWELIEYGNSVMQGGEGSPYPIIEPFRMKDIAEQKIEAAFHEAYRRLYDKVDEWFGNAILEEFGLKGKTRGLIELEDWVMQYIVKEMRDLGREALEQTPTGKTLIVIKEIDFQYEVYKSTAGKLGIRRRGSKGFEAIFME